ncbi:MAG: DUF6650 family protein [Gaiellaceae bacterium]
MTKKWAGVWNRVSTWTRGLRRRAARSLRRVSGINTPVGGISWVPSQSEREELRKLVVFLEDRRALFNPYDLEAEIFVEQSVQQIRSELTKVLQAIGEDVRAGEPLRNMRSACQRYLTKSDGFKDGHFWHHRPPRHFHDHGGDEDDDFILALGELRGVFGLCVGQIASIYSIEVHGELAALLPEAGSEDK